MLSLTAVLVGCSMVLAQIVSETSLKNKRRLNREFRGRNKRGSAFATFEFATYSHSILVAYWQSTNLVMMSRAGTIER